MVFYTIEERMDLTEPNVSKGVFLTSVVALFPGKVSLVILL